MTFLLYPDTPWVGGNIREAPDNRHGCYFSETVSFRTFSGKCFRLTAKGVTFFSYESIHAAQDPIAVPPFRLLSVPLKAMVLLSPFDAVQSGALSSGCNWEDVNKLFIFVTSFPSPPYQAFLVLLIKSNKRI